MTALQTMICCLLALSMARAASVCNKVDVVHLIDDSTSVLGSDFVSQALHENARSLGSAAHYGLATYTSTVSVVRNLAMVTSIDNLPLVALNQGKNLGAALEHGYNSMMTQANGMRHTSNCRFMTLMANGGSTLGQEPAAVLSSIKQNNPAHFASIHLKIVAYSHFVSILDGCNFLRATAIANGDSGLEMELMDEDACMDAFEAVVDGERIIENFAYVSTFEEAVQALSQDYSSCQC
eukprot:m.96084 g.96084  ORF g.96084 m.96084 type:complete len:237 (-) comp13526_c2_seq2:2817-3527(-)